MQQDESDVCRDVQKGFLNFYGLDSTNPYVALAAQGPWIVTSTGSVIYDTGGYGMLGFGHNSPVIVNALAKPQVSPFPSFFSFPENLLLESFIESFVM